MIYKTKGVCSREISFDIVEGRLYNVQYVGGCHGNLQAVGRLVEGLTVQEVVDKLAGIKCGLRGTSCADQLSKAVQQYL